MNKSIVKEVIIDRYEQLLDKIVQKSSYAESLSYFTDALKKPFNPNTDPEEECNSTIVFGTYCIQVPDELIYAAGAQPVRLCMGVEETADKIPLLLEETGCLIVADELCSSERIFSDVVTVDNKTEAGLLQAISDRYLLPCTCPTFSTNRNRLKRLLEFVHQFKIDGIVYHVLKGCHPYDIESFQIEKSIKERNIPFLKIETDYSQEDKGQIKTRIEAFSEMLQFGVRNRY